MVDLEGFAEFVRSAIRDLEGGARDVIRPAEENVIDIGSRIKGGVGDIFRRDIGETGQAIRRDVGELGSGIKRDFNAFGDFLRRHKLGLGLLGGAGITGLGAYELLRSQGGNNYSQLGAAGALGYLPGPGLGYSQGPAQGAGGTCDSTCGGNPELPPCPGCGSVLGTAGFAGPQGSGSIFSDPIIWLIIAIVLVIIIVVIMYYHKKKKKG